MDDTVFTILTMFSAYDNVSEFEKSKNKTEKSLGIFQFKTKIVWFNLLGFLLLHLFGIYGVVFTLLKLYYLQPATSLWTIFLVFFGGEGITMGAHRLWSHKAFKVTKPLECMLIVMQTIAGQNCLYIWARDHRQHHKYTDTDADPHNSGRGFFFSHIGWLMMKKHPDVIKMGKSVDMSDLEANPIVMFQKKYYKSLYAIFAVLIPVYVPIYFWNESLYNSFLMSYIARTVALLNITWTVNSFAHFFGYRPYDSTMRPVECFFVSFITLGEGWHNYHHVFPWDYKAAEWGTGFNSTRMFIEFAAKFGWAYDLRQATQGVVNARAKRLGDGTHIPSEPPQPMPNPSYKIKKEENSWKEDIIPRRTIVTHGTGS